MTPIPSDQVGTRLMFENERVRVWDLALAPGVVALGQSGRTKK